MNQTDGKFYVEKTFVARIDKPPQEAGPCSVEVQEGDKVIDRFTTPSWQEALDELGKKGYQFAR